LRLCCSLDRASPGRSGLFECGFFRLYGPAEPDLTVLGENLGERFLGEEATCVKLYPSCGVTLALTEALLAVRERGEIAFDQVVDLSLRISPTMNVVCGGPYAPAETPEVDAQFNVRYVAANAILRGRATLDEFTASAATAPDVVAFAQRIDVAEVPAFGHFDQCEAIISNKDGARRVIPAQFGRGWPENPPSQDDFIAKFRQCAAFSERSSWRDSDALIAAIKSLRTAPSVESLIAAFAA